MQTMGLYTAILVSCLYAFASATLQVPDDIKVPRAPICPPQTTNQTYFFPNPYNCSTYYICSNEVAIEQNCPPGLQFNPAVSTCDFPFNFNCTEITQEVVYPVMCGDNPIIPSPYDCHFFLYCLEDNYANLVKCPDPLVFNPDLLVCDWSANVQCKT